MNLSARFKKVDLRDESGFTLIEILIVVILLGILATIIIPQVSVSTDDAKLNALKTSINNIRGAVELYYYQHNSIYPGMEMPSDGTTDTANDGEAAAALQAQLTMYTNANGQTSTTKNTATHKYGPYLKDGLPTNPYNDLATFVTDRAEDDITVKTGAGANAGWKFYPQTGILVAGDGSHDDL